MFNLLTILIIIAAILLILVVLIQQPKGSGLAANFSSTQMIMGVKRTTDFVEKATWTLIIAIMVMSALSNFTVSSSDVKGTKAINQEELAK